MNTIVVDVLDCARCGGFHSAVTFSPFRQEAGPYTHWASCPQTGEPVLMRTKRLDDAGLKP